MASLGGRTIQIYFLHLRFIRDSTSHHKSCCFCDLSIWQIELLRWETTASRLSCWQRKPRTSIKQVNLIVNLPWGQAVLLWPLLRGRWLLQNEPGSRRSWPPVGSSGVSEPRQTAENAWGQETETHLYAPFWEICWQDSPVPWPAFPFW